MSSVLVAIEDNGYDGTWILMVTHDLELARMRCEAELLDGEDRPETLNKVQGWITEEPRGVHERGDNLYLYWSELSVAAMALDENTGARIERWEIST